MGGPDRPRGRAEQCSGEGLCLEEGRGRGVVSDVVCAVCERVADGGGCCHCRQVSRYDLCSQRLTLMVLTQGQLYLIEKDKTHSIQSISTQGGQNKKNQYSKFGYKAQLESFESFHYTTETKLF